MRVFLTRFFRTLQQINVSKVKQDEGVHFRKNNFKTILKVLNLLTITFFLF